MLLKLKFLVLIWQLADITQCTNPKDTYYQYEINSLNSKKLENYIGVDSDLIRQRRDTSPVGVAKSTTPTDVVTLPLANSSDTSVQNKNLSKADLNSTTLINATTSIHPALQLNEKRLLGVNGTGQRKDFSNVGATTKMPFVVSEPIDATSRPDGKSKLLSALGVGKSSVEEDETIDPFDDFNYIKNQTLKQHNITKVDEDYHQFYNSVTTVDLKTVQNYFKNFDNLTTSTLLSQSHRRAMTLKISFDFPYYGNPVRNITVATGGFLYTGDYVHSWLAATQYIAPLMANFDTSLSPNAVVKYMDNGTAFTAVWENVALQDRPEVGTFSFSATLHSTGDIVFAYLNVPIIIESIIDDKHPVKVGLSDAYIIDKTIFFARRKTIYEYHRVNFASQDIKNGSIIVLQAQPTCLQFRDCDSCLSQKTQFKCYWCPTFNRCSTGLDRKRQDWIAKNCDKTQITESPQCPTLGTKGNNYNHTENASESAIEYDSPKKSGTGNTTIQEADASVNKAFNYPQSSRVNDRKLDIHDDLHHLQHELKPTEENTSMGTYVGVMVSMVLVLGAGFWVFYAYKNPHTKSGQLLIQYRPSQWSWRRGEARYTAATIHM